MLQKIQDLNKNTFANNDSLERNHEIKPFSCKHCDKSFLHVHEVKKHIKIHTSIPEVEDEKTRNCWLLDHESVMDYNEIRHLSDQENLHKKLEIQNQIQSSINEDDSNYKPETSSNKNKKIRDNSTLLVEDSKNQIEVSLNRETELNTENVNSAKLKPSSLSKHRSKLFECSVCKAGFRTKTSLQSHFNFVHKKTGDHICSACDKSYSTKGEVRKHFATIHEQTKYDCDICSKSFRSKQGLRGHVETAHEGKKQSVECPMCSKFFQTKQVMKRHINSLHAKNRSHGCDLCGLRFAQKSQLVTHMKGKHKSVE